MGGHEIDCLNCTQGNDVIVTPRITQHADGADWKKDSEGLTRLVIQIVLAQLIDEDVVRTTQQIGKLFLDFTENTHTETRTGEGMTVDHLGRQAQFDTEAAHFVLEQLSQWLDQLELHALRQATDVVM